MPKPSTFGRRLKELRETRGLTQAQLADSSGVPAVMISHFETGARQNASMATLIKLAKALSCSVDFLLGVEGTEIRASGKVAALLRATDHATDDQIKHLVIMAEAMTATAKEASEKEAREKPNAR